VPPETSRVSKLLQAIEADAARSLVLPPGTPLAGEVERFKRYLQRCLLRTRYYHNQGSTGREIVEARTHAVDLVFRYAIQATEALPGYAPASPGSAVVALGGYGRRELSPNSDMTSSFHEPGDVRKAPRPAFGTARGLLDHNVSRRSMCWRPPLMRSRQATGPPVSDVVDRGAARWAMRNHSPACRNGAVWCVAGQETAYVQQRLEDQAQRRRRYRTPYLQEPHLKNGCGGLRDYQNLVWLTFFPPRRHHRRTAAARVDLDREHGLERAHAFRRARNDLHFGTSGHECCPGRAASGARAMGFDGSPRKRDRLMRPTTSMSGTSTTSPGRWSSGSRCCLNRRLPRCRISQARRRLPRMSSTDWVRGRAVIRRPSSFRDNPTGHAAFFNARPGLQLHPELLQLIRDQTHL
jgi:[protein-PII] uridylyltransferase